jgi:hypothetical protein
VTTDRQDNAERFAASAGSVGGDPVAWAAMDGTKTVVACVSASRAAAECFSADYGFPEVVPLYRQPHGVAVRLPQVPDDFEISEANGYAAAIADFKKALCDAGIAWTE